MDVEAIVWAWILGIALLPIALLLGRRFRGPAPWLLFAVLGAVSLAGIIRDSRAEPEIHTAPEKVASDGYVTSDSCRSCHPREHATWHGSYHRTMTQRATPQSVLGDFNDRTVEIYDHRYQLERIGDEFWAEFDVPASEAADGLPQPRIRRRIALVTGSHHMQVYWYKTRHEGRLGMLPIVHLREANRWVSRRSAFLEPPSETRDEGGRWNVGCINCHATHGETRRENALEFDSQVAELGISCEACHGPAENHVPIHQNPVTRYASRRDIDTDQSIVQPGRIDPKRSTEICGQCHSASFPKSLDHQHNYRPGNVLAEFRDQLDPAKPESFKGDAASMEFSFWSDGMIRVAGREYNGLRRTPCYTHGDTSRTISCLSCHESHQQGDDTRDRLTWADDQLKPQMRSNVACTQCHEEMANSINLRKHTHHPPDSAGSNCYNCHMPHTTYGLLKGTRSHTIDSPNVASTLVTGRINACNQCHIDKSLGWTAGHLATWYGIKSPALEEERQEISEAVFQSLTGDAGQRALMAWTLGWKPAHEASENEWIAPYLAQLLNDPYDAVRFIAHRSIKRLPAFDGFEFDYVSSAENRKARSEAARRTWERSSVRPSPMTLINEDGELETKRFTELLKRRNDKPMYLIE